MWRVDICPFPLYHKFSAHRGEGGKVIAAVTEALADIGASAGQTKVVREEKQKWELLCQGQVGPTDNLDLAMRNLCHMSQPEP